MRASKFGTTLLRGHDGHMEKIDIQRWNDLMDAGVTCLADLASRQEHIDYSTFNDRVCDGLFDLSNASQRDELGRLLGDISRTSVRKHQVMLPALVHHKGKRTDVRKGFYTLAVGLGRLDPKADSAVRSVFLGREIDAAYKEFGQ